MKKIEKLFRCVYSLEDFSIVNTQRGLGATADIILATTAGMKLALKKFTIPDTDIIYNELEIQCRFQHPNILPIYDVFRMNGSIFAVAEWCPTTLF